MNQLSYLLQHAPPGTDKVLHAFALAECLTDHVARPLYETVPVPGLAFGDFVSALRYSDIYEPRNSEWNIAESARQELNAKSALSADETKKVHALLLKAAAVGDKTKAGWETPHYLFTDAGLAYHKAAVGEIEPALQHYSNCSRGNYRGNQWLGAKFAEKQEQEGIIPPGSIETLFLRAMVLFKTGGRRKAMPMLRTVASSEKRQREVAIALHITANEDTHRHRYKEAEAAYLRSIEIGKVINHHHHVAQTEHSLANMYARQHRYEQAELRYLRSIEMLGALRDPFGVAQTEHSLANMYARQRRYEQAELLYLRSIEMLGALRDPFGVAQTEHSLANMYARQKRYKEAEAAYIRSIKMDDELGNRFGVAQTEHSLANMYARQQRYDEAKAAYLRSIEIGRNLGKDRHLAQVYRSYALLLQDVDPDEALWFLEESLRLNKKFRNRRGIQIVQKSIGKLKRKN
ncbi:tetratricopeptide repeat protein [Parasphingorhabdus sp.]|uniref:tetratricopeptide repeat protein n=1 Tax=Parasphingorhabdus sp. TaxID=2709688 RepID=UPI003D2BC6BF